MFVSKELKEKNIAEYLIYMWQVEDRIRANGCDMERIRTNLIDPCSLTQDERSELAQWYADLIEMMRCEDVTEQGHLQVNRNVIIWLTELHQKLLGFPRFSDYHAAYYRALPFIVELRTRGARRDQPELETCFEALYGLLLLRLQGRTVSDETGRAQEAISALLARLAAYYRKEKQGQLTFDNGIG